MFELNNTNSNQGFTVSANPTPANTLNFQVMPTVYQDLQRFAGDPDLKEKLKLAFGSDYDVQTAETILANWLSGDFSAIPPIELVERGDIAGANGAFAATTNKIYLPKDILTGDTTNTEAIKDVILEEIGQSIDAQVNNVDTPGDEGAIFAATVQGKDLSQSDVEALKSEDDRANVVIDGQTISIEKADYDWGNRWYVQAFDTANSYKSLTQYDFGSNTRNDGKKGLVQNWGSSSPKPGTIPNDSFALAFWTQADFQQGQTYNFNVRADDSYALAALPVGANNSNQWEFISNWKWNGDAFGGKTVQFTPKNNGKYWVLAYYREIANTAYFDISWDKVSSEPPLFSNPSGSNPLRGFLHPTKGNQQGGEGIGNTGGHDSPQEFADDIKVGIGTNVYAMRSGTVLEVKEDVADLAPDQNNIGKGSPFNTNYVWIKLDDNDGVDDNYRALYLHLQKNSVVVNPGDRVNQGDLIARSGHNGDSSGPHLHVDISRPNGSLWYQRQTVPYVWDEPYAYNK